MKKSVLYYLIFLIFNFSFLIHDSFCQYQNVMISNQYGPQEVSIIINPKNINHIVAGSNIYTANSYNGYYYSTNGGLNWAGGVLQSTLANPDCDPVMLVDTAGIFYYISKGYFQGLTSNCLMIMKSTNLGINWSSVSTFGIDGKYQDKPYACVDWSNSIWRNNIYVMWTEFSIIFGPADSSIILFSRSTNGGLNWSQPLRISKRIGDARDSSNTVEGAVPCTGPNGEIYTSWSGPITMYSGQYGIFFNKSTDGGNTWLDSERVVAMQPGGEHLTITGLSTCNGMPVTCCDLSTGPFRGNVYINFADQRNGLNDADIWFIKSTNGGLTWSDAKRVNNDPPGKNQFFSWMTVDQSTGYIYFVFYDQRNLPANAVDVFIARSTDGGETFQNSKVSSSPFYLYNNPFIGDYINISACNGHVRPVWTKWNINYPSIYTAIVDSFYAIGINRISDIVPSSYSLHQNYPNPFNPTTKIKFDITSEFRSQKSEVKLVIYDITGREITTLVNEQLQPGTYEVTFDGSNLPSGVYFYKLQADNFIENKKMVLLK